jgi:hypothetical protein
VHALYDDFSTPCFDGQHHLIMGASFASCGDLASRFARFHFRPHFFQVRARLVDAGGYEGAPKGVGSCVSVGEGFTASRLRLSLPSANAVYN